MKHYLAITLVLFASAAPAQELLERVATARSAAQAFAAELKGELQQAMQSGGPVNGIAVCHDMAPEIAAAASRETGMQVGRTSLKVRNPANAPDDWERTVLEGFEARQAAGQDPRTMEFFAVLDGGKTFRYMKAIPTAELCLVCHGENIPEAVQAQLDVLYPNDQARGFRQGDLRGAFTISQSLD